MKLTPDDWYVLNEARRTLNLDIFTNYFFRKPTTGTRWMPDDAIGHYRDAFSYEMLLDIWNFQGKPDSFRIDQNGTQYEIKRIGFNEAPEFLLNHGVLLLDWMKPLVDMKTDVALAITATSTSKTFSICAAALAYCVLFPGYRHLHTAPSDYQADVMRRTAAQIVSGTRYEELFVKRVRYSDELFNSRTGAITVRSPFGLKYLSEFVCRTTGHDAMWVIGESVDCVSIDEVQQIPNIYSLVTEFITRGRGLRDDGSPRNNKLVLLTNPGDNPQLNYLKTIIEKIRDDPEQKVTAVLIEGLNQDVNPYMTKKQRDVQQALLDEQGRRRWMLGEGDDAQHARIFTPTMLNACHDKELDNLLRGDEAPRYGVMSRDGLGIQRYQFPYRPGNYYIVAGDVGSANATSIMYNNVPVVVTIDCGPRSEFLEHPFLLCELAVLDGNGDYKPWIEKFKNSMLTYGLADGYYDATSLGTAFEDTEIFDSFRTTPISFSGGNKNWAKTIFITLMQNRQFRWPFLEMLWYQASEYRETGPGVKSIPDDILAAMMTFCLALRYNGDLWSIVDEKYEFVKRDRRWRNKQVIKWTPNATHGMARYDRPGPRRH